MCEVIEPIHIASNGWHTSTSTRQVHKVDIVLTSIDTVPSRQTWGSLLVSSVLIICTSYASFISYHFISFHEVYLTAPQRTWVTQRSLSRFWWSNPTLAHTIRATCGQTLSETNKHTKLSQDKLNQSQSLRSWQWLSWTVTFLTVTLTAALSIS